MHSSTGPSWSALFSGPTRPVAIIMAVGIALHSAAIGIGLLILVGPMTGGSLWVIGGIGLGFALLGAGIARRHHPTWHEHATAA
jgi:hypothetical protein